jgi:hypothetical protein
MEMNSGEERVETELTGKQIERCNYKLSNALQYKTIYVNSKSLIGNTQKKSIHSPLKCIYR